VRVFRVVVFSWGEVWTRQREDVLKWPGGIETFSGVALLNVRDLLREAQDVLDDE
jgi:hypothetical protein